MKSQYIQLLTKQIEKLNNDDFDLEAWKSSSISVLNRVFGKEDGRKDQIEKLKIDYSSWALRDSNANYKPVESAKRMGKEILKSAIEEIEIFGEPQNHSSEVLGKEFAKDLQAMSESQRKKHFEGMKKEKLVELLMKMTMTFTLIFLSSCNFGCVGAACSSGNDVRFNVIDENGNDLFFGDSALFSPSDMIIEYPNGDQYPPRLGIYFNEPDTSLVFHVNGSTVKIFIENQLIDSFKIESGVEESQCCSEYYVSSFKANRLQVIDSVSFFVVLTE